MTKRYGRFALAGACVVVGVCWWIFHLRALGVEPPAGGDEMSLLNIPFRFIYAGDWRYPLLYSDTFNAGAVRAYPPLLAFAPLTGLQWIFGFSAFGARIISALSMIGVAGLIRSLGVRQTRSVWLTVALLGLLAVTPTFFLMSRSVRFEQMTLLFGVASVALPFLILPRIAVASPSRLKGLLIWSSCAILAALAAGAHPLALGFGFPLAVNVLLGHRYWRGRDGLHAIERFIAVMAGGVPLVLVSVLPLIWVEGGYGAYLKSIEYFVTQRNATFEDFFYVQAPTLLSQFLSRSAVAHILEVSHTTFMLNYSSAAIALPALLAPFLIGCWVVAAAIRQRHLLLDADTTPMLVGLSSLVGLTIVKFNYPVNTTYGGYIAVGCLLALALAPEMLFRKPIWRFSAIAILLMAGGSAALSVRSHAEKVLFLDATTRRTLDQTYQMLRDEGQAAFEPLRETEQRPPRIYTDTLSWSAAFPYEHSYLDILSGASRGPVDGAALDVSALEFFLNYLPAPEGTTARVAKARRLLDAFAPLSLAGVLFDGLAGTETQLFRAAAGQMVPLRIRLIDKRGQSNLIVTESGQSLVSTSNGWELPATAPGSCLVVVFIPSRADAPLPRLVSSETNAKLKPLGLNMKTAAARVLAISRPQNATVHIEAPDVARAEVYSLRVGSSPCGKSD